MTLRLRRSSPNCQALEAGGTAVLGVKEPATTATNGSDNVPNHRRLRRSLRRRCPPRRTPATASGDSAASPRPTDRLCRGPPGPTTGSSTGLRSTAWRFASVWWGRAGGWGRRSAPPSTRPAPRAGFRRRSPHHRRERSGITIAGSLDALAATPPDVVVDFTVVAAARETLPWLAEHGIHAVVGTTGFTDDDIAEPADRFPARTVSCGPLRHRGRADDPFRAAPFFDRRDRRAAHDAKRCASGTAMTTRPGWPRLGGLGADPTTTVLSGARGSSGPAIHVHSLRLRAWSLAESSSARRRPDAHHPPRQLRARASCRASCSP